MKINLKLKIYKKKGKKKAKNSSSLLIYVNSKWNGPT